MKRLGLIFALIFAMNGFTFAEKRHIAVPFFDKLLDIESQCGATLDFQDVETYDGTYGVTTEFVDSHQGPVGQHVESGCSGTLITNDIYLSVGHCDYQVGDTVRFGYQRDINGNIQNGEDFEVIEIIEQQDIHMLNYVVVRLERDPGLTYGFTRIIDREPAVGEQVTIIGHPYRWPKQVSVGPRIDTASSIGSHAFRHQADTLAGSAGSGVIGSDGRLVGLHVSAGCRTAGNILGNHAVRMTVLLDNSPILAEIAELPVASVNSYISGSNDVVFPVANTSGKVNDSPYRCSGTYWIDSRGSNWSSHCSTGWEKVDNIWGNVSCMDDFITGTDQVVFPITNTNGSNNPIQYRCVGDFWVDTRGSNWSSSCATGWEPF